MDSVPKRCEEEALFPQLDSLSSIGASVPARKGLACYHAPTCPGARLGSTFHRGCTMQLLGFISGRTPPRRHSHADTSAALDERWRTHGPTVLRWTTGRH